jgi:hypothetical protein
MQEHHHTRHTHHLAALTVFDLIDLNCPKKCTIIETVNLATRHAQSVPPPLISLLQLQLLS